MPIFKKLGHVPFKDIFQDVQLGESTSLSLAPVELLCFEYQYNTFFFNPYTKRFICFDQLPRLGPDVRSVSLSRQQLIFGKNVIDIEEKTLTSLVLEQIVHPFNVFQVVSVIIWCCEEYMLYALCIFLMSICSFIMTVIETRRSNSKIRKIARYTYPVSILRSGSWQRISSEDLVPGDIYALEHASCEIPCDSILLEGNAIVDESMLTGETTPVVKSCLHKDSFHQISLSGIFKNQKHALFAGTKLLRASNTSSEPAMAVAYQTGFMSQKGVLIQSILFPRPDNFQFHRDSMMFIGILASIGKHDIHSVFLNF